jgi:hypothetical protein
VKKIEIGSEFWDIPKTEKYNGLFGKNTSFHLSGRAALNAIIKDIKKNKNVKTAALPSWCCDSMIMPFLINGIDVTFYSVSFENGELLQKVGEADGIDVILLMDYFGFIRQKEIKTEAVVIRDLTHTFFCENIKGADYYFGSLRKWAGFLTGGYAYSDDGHKIETEENGKEREFAFLRETAMSEKKNYLSVNSNSKEYLKKFSQAEEFLDENFSGLAAQSDIDSARHLDNSFIKAKRRENAKILLENFKEIAVFKEVLSNDCPLFVPLYIENGKRDGLKQHLTSKRIYCPVHWGISKFHNLNDTTKKIYKNEISVICDQRYNAEDMQRIVSEINYFLY